MRSLLEVHKHAVLAQAEKLEGARAELRERNRELADSNAQLRRLAAELEATAAAERRARTQLQQANAQLQEAQSQLVQREKLAALGQLVAGLAHELNNPLAYLINDLAVLGRDTRALRDLVALYRQQETGVAAEAAEVRQRLDALADQIDLPYTLANLDVLLTRSGTGLSRIRHIVRDLRDFGRLCESELHGVDLNAAIEATLRVVAQRAQQQQVQLTADLAPLPPVTCYPTKINQVVLNLVVNALEASAPGGTVRLRTRATTDGVEIHVLDGGRGIDPAIRDKIFDPFFTTKPPGQGTGLGLSICHGIVAEHGGWIAVDSAPGRGAVFTVHLPLHPARPRPRPEQHPTGAR